jgi:hypothetical protein
MSEVTRERLDLALASAGGSETAGDRSLLLARRDSLLEAAGVAA